MNTANIHILVNTNFMPAELDRLREVDPRLVVHHSGARDYEQLTAWAEEAGVDLAQVQIYCGGFDVPIGDESQRHRWPNLAWLQLSSAGYNKFEHTWLFGPDGPLITNASGIHASQMGEWSLGAMLDWRWRFGTARRFHSEAHWPPNRWVHFRRGNLRGMTLGIVGYGAIGREVARLAQALGMEILALKANPNRREDTGFCLPGLGDPQGEIPSAWYGMDGLPQLLAASDVVLLALPLLAGTHHLINAETLSMMRQDALLINVGRGGLIDQAALIHALAQERIFAALDVTDPEPLPSDDPLWRVSPERLLLTPHVSGIAVDYTEKLSMLMAENLRRWLAGERLLNVVSEG